MTEEMKYWNRIFTERNDEKPVYDDWLDKHASILETSRDVPVIDLGCGIGCDSLYLSERGFSVIACDLSEEALRRLRRHVPEAKTLRLDLQERLPFTDGSAKLVIADLSLHYFSWTDTEAIVDDIRRVLEPNGCLLCRVNSVHDVEFGAGRGIELEPNYFEQDGRRKRFFNESQVDRLFQDWRTVYKHEAVMTRYGRPKRLWELALRSPV
ncbi:class I SAM-dependent methyltransferase [Paenibacillus piri]|uniref:Class I SAM-dependent methyltransferase n=2 Tax=Paenibacillus piri TaxID=2547395 RepID=A0A4R5KV77_9BACL|nr:class I SAM-dependent methyltransferase [Paenibacillus piri]